MKCFKEVLTHLVVVAVVVLVVVVAAAAICVVSIAFAEDLITRMLVVETSCDLDLGLVFSERTDVNGVVFLSVVVVLRGAI
mmetsp:Transcript_97828/g.152971  ORF Transcript_97828/g.152971 Transcript_97828/m.152971 type:complete len:81 (+) Transcript_97828:493-735(+)